MTAVTRELELEIKQIPSGTLITTPEFPELYLVDGDRETVFGDLLKAAEDLWYFNTGESARASVLPYGRGEPMTNGLYRLEDGVQHILRLEVESSPSRGC